MPHTSDLLWARVATSSLQLMWKETTSKNPAVARLVNCGQLSRADNAIHSCAVLGCFNRLALCNIGGEEKKCDKQLAIHCYGLEYLLGTWWFTNNNPDKLGTKYLSVPPPRVQLDVCIFLVFYLWHGILEGPRSSLLPKLMTSDLIQREYDIQALLSFLSPGVPKNFSSSLITSSICLHVIIVLSMQIASSINYQAVGSYRSCFLDHMVLGKSDSMHLYLQNKKVEGINVLQSKMESN